MLGAALSRGGSAAADLSLLEPELAEHAGDAALVETLAGRRPDVLALSLYPWNLVRSVRLAGQLRARLPGLTVAAGGPEVNDATLPLLLERGVVDLAVTGEGEVTFPEALTALAEGREPSTVSGLATALRTRELEAVHLAVVPAGHRREFHQAVESSTLLDLR